MAYAPEEEKQRSRPHNNYIGQGPHAGGNMPGSGPFRSRRVLLILPLVLLTWLLVSHISIDGSDLAGAAMIKRPAYHNAAHNSQGAKVNNATLVPLEAHIMSKCPDARDCLRDLVVPAMEKVVDMVDFNLSYIGKIESDDTIKCMHGSTECLGDMLSLCAKELFPNRTIVSLGFTNCLVMSYSKIPDRALVEGCALEHGIAFEDLNSCISEEGKGLDLLRESVERSHNAGVVKSCTVRVAGETFCVRDGGEWKDCEGGHEPKDLVAEIRRRYGTA